MYPRSLFLQHRLADCLVRGRRSEQQPMAPRTPMFICILAAGELGESSAYGERVMPCQGTVLVIECLPSFFKQNATLQKIVT